MVYKVTTNADGLLKITLFALQGGDMYARLYDADSTTVLSTIESYNNTSAVLSKDGLAAGTYYIQLFPYSTSFGPYKLSDTLYTPKQTNDKEPDNYAIKALRLGVDSVVQGHLDYYNNKIYDNSDWYKVTIPQDGYLKVTLSSLNGADLYASVFENDTTTQVGNTVESYNNNPQVINLDGLAAGTYYIHLFPYSTSFGPYTLSDSLFTYNHVDKEPNGNAYQASTIPVNDSVTGHIDFYGNGSDAVDWWKINYTGTNSSSLKINYKLDTHKTGGIGDVYFQVYSDTNSNPLNSQEIYGTNNIGSITLPFISQGYYYIKVFPYSNSFGVYSITDSFTQANIAKISVSKYGNGKTCGNDSIVYGLSGSHAPYMVRLYKNGSLYDSIMSSTTSVTFNNLNAGNYYATAFGDGATGSAFSTSTTTQLLPPAPTGLTTTNIGMHNGTLHWLPVSCANYYRVQYRKVGSNIWITITVTKDSLPLLNLNGGTTYSWHVASVDSIPNQTFVSPYSDSTIFRTIDVLPVSFAGFSATLQNNRGVLNWVTAVEINAKGFDVEKSSDGLLFSSIGFVASKSGSIKSDYNFTDNNLVNGSNYYRLKEVDNNGNYQYSHIAKIDYLKFAWKIYGNPGNNSSLQLMLDKQANVTIQILSVNGSIIKSIQKGNLSVGNYTIPLTMNNASAGIYVVKLMIGNKSFTTKIIKQ